MSEQRQDKNLLSEPHKTESDEIEIDLVDIFRKIIAIRKKLYKAVGIGFIIGIIVAVSIPKQYTVKVTLSPEMGNAKGSNGLAGLAASFLGDGALIGESTDALNASLSADIVSSTPFLFLTPIIQNIQKLYLSQEKDVGITLHLFSFLFHI